MRGARRFLAHESRSKYTLFLRKWQGYDKKNCIFLANYLFFRIFALVFLLEQSFVSIYNKVRARKKQINKKQDIFMDKKIKALFFRHRRHVGEFQDPQDSAEYCGCFGAG